MRDYNDVSEGRFIIISPGHLDPLIYRNNRSITMAGKLIGMRKKTIGEREFTYLLFGAEQIYLWKREVYDYWPYPYYYGPYYYPYP